jgi:hypothetical protein
MLRQGRAETRSRPKLPKQNIEIQVKAPVRGWLSDSSIAGENPDAAEVLENMFPTTRGVRARRGSTKHATIGSTDAPTLMPYLGPAAKALFGVCAGNIYNITAPASPTAIPAVATGGLTNNELSYLNFTTAGGDFLLTFNGVDLHRIYNGTTWAINTPAITGVSSANIIQACVHADRIWMVQKDSRKVWYLPILSIGGAATEFTIPFPKGGKILFITTWSADSGSGSANRFVAVTDEGDVRVYEGDFPGGTFRLFGAYSIPKPLGRFAFEQIAGDVLIATVGGVVPMSEVISKDPAALKTTAVSKGIEPDWLKRTVIYPNKNWKVAKWDVANLAFVSVPVDIAGNVPECLAVNLITGSWCRVTGWDCRSMVVYDDKLFFSTSNGIVAIADTGGSDMGAAYTCRLAMWPSRFETLDDKQFMQVLPTFEASTPFSYKISVSVNNKIDWPVPPAPPINALASAVWDVGKWDEMIWDATGVKVVSNSQWRSVKGQGRVGALLMQMQFQNTTPPDVEYTDSILAFSKASFVS